MLTSSSSRRGIEKLPSAAVIFLVTACLCLILSSSSSASKDVPPPGVVKRAAGSLGELSTVSFDEGYTPLFAEFNIRRSDDSKNASLLLNRYAGSGFISSTYYDYGFFSAKIKLPGNYTAGVVVAFYTSNADVFKKNHDELDIEFLGNVKGQPWRFQTNIYGNGSTARGREERYKLWFDPTTDFHRYSILWNSKRIIFFVDNVPIREIIRSDAMGGDYPSKPMSVYSTIWDASSWATNGGKHGVKYTYSPFIATFTDFVLEGCPVDFINQVISTGDRDECDEKKAKLEHAPYAKITREGRAAMRWFREKYMYYSYCYDSVRYPVQLPECTWSVETEKVRFSESGRLKYEGIPRSSRLRRKRGKGKRKVLLGRRKPMTDQGVDI